jgi:hypothetical protein
MCENQKIADLLDDPDSRVLGMVMLGRLDIDRIALVVDMCKLEDDQKVMLVLWFGKSIDPMSKPFTGSKESWKTLMGERKVKHPKPHLSIQLITSPPRVVASRNRASQNRHRSGMQQLGLIPYKDWSDDIYLP